MLYGVGIIYNFQYELKAMRLRNPGCKISSELARTDLRSNDNANCELVIFIYNSFFDNQDWYSEWDSVKGSRAVRTVRNCPKKCLFTSDPYFLSSADSVLVSLAAYESNGGKPV